MIPQDIFGLKMANNVAEVSAAAGKAGTPGPATEEFDMKGVEATPEEQERLATGNNNGSLDCKHTGSRPLSTIGQSSIFHSVTFFMIVFLSGWVLQGMFLTYLVSVMTTIEKLFNVESKTTGTLLSATEVGQICTALFLTYLAGRGHRPRWIAYMMLVLSVGVIGVVIPHLLYGTQLLDVHMYEHKEGAAPVCYTSLNSTSLCDASQIENQDTRSNITAVVIPFLYCCLLVVGVGSTGICTLGMPYVDDNIGSTQSPLYVAITMSTRVIGPALGFLLGALCIRVYVDPFVDPGFDINDPRWVGAWWLGLLFISTFILLLAILMFGFPRYIKEEYPPVAIKPPESFCKDFYISMKRLVTNDILMLRMASSVLHLVPISGIYSFLPKYLEKQFRLPSHEANLVSGLGGILVMGIGSMMSGTIFFKLSPKAKTVAAWTATTAAVYVIGMIILMFVGCPEQNYRLISDGDTGGIANTHLSCSSGCNCTDVPFNPVCGQDSFTYLSPCQAGCLDSYQLDNHTWLYSDCSCINSTTFGDKALDAIDRYQLYNTSTGVVLPPNKSFAVSGECEGTCNQIYTFVAVFATIMFVHATGEVGSMLIVMRCTVKEDKAMAMGVIQFGVGLFGNVPCPIVFGAAVDAACRARDLLCNVFGTCVSYDINSFRHYYLGLAALMMFLGFIMDLLVWSKAGQIDLHPDAAKKPSREGNPDESNPDECNPDECNPDGQKAPLHPALLGPLAPPVDTQL